MKEQRAVRNLNYFTCVILGTWNKAAHIKLRWVNQISLIIARYVDKSVQYVLGLCHNLTSVILPTPSFDTEFGETNLCFPNLILNFSF
jgi:hypothetical protein